ncbi:MAG TPA: DoxX family protein [Rhizomicrobium sp.]|nr:DoxX family protein [Rhizomicrobium sp.]
MSFSEQISPLVGRWILGWFFLSQAWQRMQMWDGTITLMAMRDVPVPPLVLVLVLIVLILGGVSFLLGYQTRHAAIMLFAFVIIVTVFMHDYWNIRDHIDRASDYALFARNIAIAGGLLFLVGMGPGPFALDNRGKKRR